MKEAPKARTADALLRRLHRTYWRGAALNYFFARRVRATGFGVGIALAVTTVLGVAQPENQQQFHVYLVFSLTAALFAMALPLAFFRKPGALEARRELPRYATAGEQVHCTIHLRNPGTRDLRSVWLHETPPDPRPPLNLFLRAREPEEATRNAFDRTFAYYRWQWLMDRLRLYEGGQSAHSVDVPAGGTVEVPVELTPARRGVIRLDDLRALLPDPFGLFQRCEKLPTPPATLTVLPPRYRLPPVELPGSGRFQIGGEAATNAIGTSGEFVGLREYRPGDPIRQIHWKSWARTGRPIVRELEDTFYPRYGLVLDTFPASGHELLFEDAVSVAASFASTIDTRESLLDLMFIKDRAHTVTVGRGMARSEVLLEVLAGVEPETVPHFDTLANLVLKHREELTSCLVVLCGWSEERAAFIRQLASQGLPCTVLATGTGPAPTGFPGHWIESGQLARDLGSLPIRLKPVVAG
ncbi:DUF58 domain-containing protein [Luteolibacter sp. LG18]|uniref:DUF58 domain-containing protein n=1 Tax=Luteolibacter sp. LG18 TaxID=2819286 RepID=UPI002B28BD86|nr:hypothetical protein llg_06580 [Luteolibacter sp. LG18]